LGKITIKTNRLEELQEIIFFAIVFEGITKPVLQYDAMFPELNWSIFQLVA
jgi:hypothetical protein